MQQLLDRILHEIIAVWESGFVPYRIELGKEEVKLLELHRDRATELFGLPIVYSTKPSVMKVCEEVWIEQEVG